MSIDLEFFLQYFLVSLDGLFVGIMMEMAFGKSQTDQKRYWLKAAGRVFCFWVLSLLLVMPGYPNRVRLQPVASLILNLVGVSCLIKVFYKAKWKDLIFWVFVCQISNVLAEVIVLSCIPAKTVVSIDYSQEIHLQIYLIGTLLLALLRPGIVILLRQPFINWDKIAKPLLLAIMVLGPASILLVRVLRTGDKMVVRSIQISIALFLVVFVIILIASIMTRKATLDKLRHVKEIMSFQDQYFESLRENDLKIQKIRHDYKNVLLTVSALLKQDKAHQALEILHSLQKELDAPLEDESLQKLEQIQAQLLEIENSSISTKLSLTGRLFKRDQVSSS